MRIDLRDVCLSYGASSTVPVIDKLNISFNSNELVAVLGPSGCGKTTLIKAISGLLPLQSGHISFPDFQGSRRPSCYMAFQEHSLFPWLNVVDNISIGLEAQGVPKDVRTARAIAMLKKIALEDSAYKMPHELSGGMKQRVSLLRLLISDGDVLLFDEPLSSVDAQTRLMLQQELLDLWSDDPTTSVYITHDIEEALILADRVIVLSAHGGDILADINVPLSRPRMAIERKPAKIEKLRWEIWDLLAEPNIKHQTATPNPVST